MENNGYYLFKHVDCRGMEFIVRIPHGDTDLSEMSEVFAQFLRGCGFYLEDVEIIKRRDE